MADEGGGDGDLHFKYIVIGGGIAGVTCAETVIYILSYLGQLAFSGHFPVLRLFYCTAVIYHVYQWSVLVRSPYIHDIAFMC